MHQSLGRGPHAAALAAAAAATLAISLLTTGEATSLTPARPVTTKAMNAAESVARKTPPGPAGPTIVVEQHARYSGYDLATDASSGTAYLGWISSSAASGGLRDVHLCVLPFGATGCSGGVLTAVLGSSSAAGLQVEVIAPGQVLLAWFDQVGPSGRLFTAAYSGGVLSGAMNQAEAPFNGALLDLVYSPSGLPWAVTQNLYPFNANHVQVRQGLSGTPVELVAPWVVGNASLAFHKDQPVVVVAEYGDIGEPLQQASGFPFTGFAPIPKTGAVGIFSDVVGTARGVRLLASEAKAGYRPVVAKWTGHAFSKPKLIGDNDTCPPYSHDAVTDGSRRVADVVQHCEKLSIYNLADTKHAGIVRMATGGVSAGGPQQITTSTRGTGWVAWGILSTPSGTFSTLLVRAIRLPAELTTKSHRAGGGTVSLVAPVSCMPVSSTKAKVKAKPAKGWSVLSRQLRFDGKAKGASAKINGSNLAAGSKHKLVATAVFKKGGKRSTATKHYSFKAC